MLKLKFIFVFLVCFYLFSHSAGAAEESFGNIRPGGAIAPGYVPGSLVRLPDGRQTIIIDTLPDGQLRTDLGIILSPEGVILEGEGKGESVAIVKQPEQAEVRTPENSEPQKPDAVAPVQVLPKPTGPALVAPGGQPPITPATLANPQTVVPEQQGQLTIVELLPMTTVPGEQKTEPKAQEQPQQKTQPEKKTQIKTEPEKKQPTKSKPELPDKKQPAKPQAEKKRTEQPEKYKKPGVGQELRIPPDAGKTGNLDFLEGCWQGTRPEYYSKRTIKECFCFGANGKNGKRRVFDPQGNRMCIGAAKASLSQSGHLSVTSSGAACNDGERWGSAQMSCQNTGMKTPCSWVFPDTHGGHQSYTIPFVRVESCGR